MDQTTEGRGSHERVLRVGSRSDLIWQLISAAQRSLQHLSCSEQTMRQKPRAGGLLVAGAAPIDPVNIEDGTLSTGPSPPPAEWMPASATEQQAPAQPASATAPAQAGVDSGTAAQVRAPCPAGLAWHILLTSVATPLCPDDQSCRACTTVDMAAALSRCHSRVCAHVTCMHDGSMPMF